MTIYHHFPLIVARDRVRSDTPFTSYLLLVSVDCYINHEVENRIVNFRPKSFMPNTGPDFKLDTSYVLSN
jgi:hypothetical protein